MISSISGSGSYFFMYRYQVSSGSSSARMQQTQEAGSTGTSATSSASVSQTSFWMVNRSEGRVEPVPPVDTVVRKNAEDTIPDLFIRKGADPVEYAVRMRIQYMDPNASKLPGEEKVPGSEETKEADEDGECQTCERRKYQDGSNDMGVSFETPTRIAPEAAGAMVRSHEQEHVTRERAKAEREDRKVVSQSVTLHTDICPECGKVYISGGTTRTTTASDSKPQDGAGQESVQRSPFSAVA